MSAGHMLIAVYVGTMLFCATFAALGMLTYRFVRMGRRLDVWRDVLLGYIAHWREKERQAACELRAESDARSHAGMRESEDGCTHRDKIANFYLRGVQRP